jgi:hypothetical protein
VEQGAHVQTDQDERTTSEDPGGHSFVLKDGGNFKLRTVAVWFSGKRENSYQYQAWEELSR